MGLFGSKNANNANNANVQQQTKTQEQKVQAVSSGNVKFSFNGETKPLGERVEKILRQPRSNEYMAVFKMLDYLSQNDSEVINKLKEDMDENLSEALEDMSDEEILEAIRSNFLEEFEGLDIALDEVLVGVLSKCYIDGCDVHAISPEGKILDHYEEGCEMPAQLAAGRKAFYRHADCMCVEVYTGGCKIIMPDGGVIEESNEK